MGITKLLWLKILLKDLGIDVKDPMKIYYNNKTTINLFNNLVLHDRTKYIEIDRHSVGEKIDSKVLVLSYMEIEGQMIDMFTKALSIGGFERNISYLGMFDIYVQFEGQCSIMWSKWV